jgi:hypothetical protein
MRLHSNQSGFGYVQVVLVFLIVGLIGCTGWYIFANQKDSDAGNPSQSAKSISNFDECVAAGNAVMESYPEQCSANGQTFTKQITSQKDETEDWLLFTPENKAYSVRIPDGWSGVSLNSNLYVRSAKNLAYSPGTKAIIENLKEGGWDGPSPFALYNPGSYADQIVREGNEVGTIKTKAGLSAHKFVFTQTTEPEAIGYMKGAKVYNYYFDADGKFLQFSHVVNPGDSDQSGLVEKMIASLTINK